MASRRYRAKTSLNSNVSQINAQVSQANKRPAPKRIADNAITSATIQANAIVQEAIADGAVGNKQLLADAVQTSNILDGAVTDAKIFSVSASKISTGTLSATVTINASSITSGTLSSAVIPDLSAGKITSGTFDVARIPNLPASKITSGTLPITYGGTGASTEASARTNLNVAHVIHTHNVAQITDISTTYAQLGASVSFGNINATGSLTRNILAGGGSTTATFNNDGALIRTGSSTRYKQDIENVTYSYEDVINVLQAKKFRLKDEASVDPESRFYAGFIAEELAGTSLDIFVGYQTLPDGTKRPDSVYYAELTSALVEAIKHQDQLIKSLESRVSALETSSQ